jgi:hypothetical protein
MKAWCRIVKQANSMVSRDVFQEESGMTGSWRVAPQNIDGKKPHPDVLAIARSISSRTVGGDLLFGGDVLMPVVADMLSTGDAMMELRYGKDGGDWCIIDAQFLRSLQIYGKVNEAGELYYAERPSSFMGWEEVPINPVKIIHWRHERKNFYGTPLYLEAVPKWPALLDAEDAVDQAVRAAGFKPWVHTYPKGTPRGEIEENRERIEDYRRQGTILDIHQGEGYKMAKAEGTSDSIAPLIAARNDARYQMLPAGIPPYLFGGLVSETNSAKEISNQPALAYRRTIAAIRSTLGAGIKRIILTEIALKKGAEFGKKEGDFDISWPESEVLLTPNTHTTSRNLERIYVEH